MADNAKYERERKALDHILEKRKIELGIGAHDHHHDEKELESKIIFPEGKLSAYNPMEQKTGLPEISVVDPRDEDEKVQECVHILFRKYGKVVKYLFVTY
mmetsp:Transcript_62446/g.86826  ORF Transcript_62446/g.86826 Transcript_62446/m.86826 type:complete len:100 (-) Transcript_62446:133-432(-)